MHETHISFHIERYFSYSINLGSKNHIFNKLVHENTTFPKKNLSFCPSSLLLLQAISVSRPIWEPNSSPINPLWLPQKQLTSEAVRKRKKRRKKEKKENASIRGGLQNVLKQLCIYTHKKKRYHGKLFHAINKLEQLNLLDRQIHIIDVVFLKFIILALSSEF